MGLKLYLSLTSGNKEIKSKQDFIKLVLDTKKIEYVVVDISDPTNQEPKQFMRENGRAKEGQNVLPPQIFSEDEYLGDFDAFHEANECDELYEFLKMAPQKTKSEAEITLAEPKGLNSAEDGETVCTADTEAAIHCCHTPHDENKENFSAEIF